MTLRQFKEPHLMGMTLQFSNQFKIIRKLQKWEMQQTLPKRQSSLHTKKDLKIILHNPGKVGTTTQQRKELSYRMKKMIRA